LLHQLLLRIGIAPFTSRPRAARRRRRGGAGVRRPPRYRAAVAGAGVRPPVAGWLAAGTHRGEPDAHGRQLPAHPGRRWSPRSPPSTPTCSPRSACRRRWI